jgi:hypothetical protein
MKEKSWQMLLLGGNVMNEEQKRWYEQYRKYFGTRERLRFGCALISWTVLGLVASIPFGISSYQKGYDVFLIFLLIMIAFLLIAFRWKPAYLLFRNFLGNENLPSELPPHQSHQTRSFTQNLLMIFRWLIVLLVLYLLIRPILK